VVFSFNAARSCHWPLLSKVKILLNVLESYIKEVTDSRDEDCKINYILCGDLNSRPGSGVIELLETGNVRADSSDWYSGEVICNAVCFEYRRAIF